MRVGILGAGFMGATHAEAWARIDGVDVVGVTSGADDGADDLAAQVGARAFDDVDELLDAVDVIDICAPTDVHLELVQRGAAAGVDVICEKPLGLTPADAETAIRACEDAGVRLLVAHVVRFFPQYVAARRQVVSGAVGEPAVLRLRRLTYQPKKPAGNWFVDEQRSGGLVFDLMIHDLDVARWFAGDVTSVHARGIRAADPDAPFDQVSALLRHRRGALSYVEGSWAQPVGVFRTAFEIAGTDGFVGTDSDLDAPVRTQLRRTSSDASDVPSAAGSPLLESPYETQLRHFRDVLRGDVEPQVTAADAAAAVRLAAAVATSLRTGRAVELEEGAA